MKRQRLKISQIIFGRKNALLTIKEKTDILALLEKEGEQTAPLQYTPKWH